MQVKGESNKSSANFVQSLSWKSKLHPKGIKASPDGLCCLVSGEDTAIKLYEWNQPTSPVFSIPTGGTLYDFCWYPQMNSANPATCAFLTTSAGVPVHMRDGFTGSLLASYVGRNHLDQVCSPNAVTFNACGTSIITSSERMIHIFDVQRPTDGPTSIRPLRKGHDQNGILGSLASNPDFSKTFAVGSYTGTTCIYDEREPGELMRLIGAHQSSAGITQVQFSNDGKFLFTGARKSPFIYCWDIRNTRESIAQFERVSNNNQRIAFDLHPSGSYLVTGSQDFQAIVYNTKDCSVVARIKELPDAVNGVSIVPSTSSFSVALCTGKRYFSLSPDMESDDEQSEAEKNVIQLWNVHIQS